MEECIFKTYCGDDCVGDVLLENQPRKTTTKSTIAVSINWGNTLHKTLQSLFDNDLDLKVK